MEKSLYKFIIKPLTDRYDNEVDVKGKKLIVNTQMDDHRYVSRFGVVQSIPVMVKTELKVGDVVVVHHNVFRRFYDVRGEEKNSSSYFTEDKYFCHYDQIFLYKRGENKWRGTQMYCFVKPLEEINKTSLSSEKEIPLVGILKFSNDVLESFSVNEGDKVGFTPNSEYEFIIDGSVLYRVSTQFITIKYENEPTKEREYNRSWESSNRAVD